MELDGTDSFLCLEVELDQEVVIDVSGEEAALVDADGGGNVLLLCVLGLVNIGTFVLGCNAALVELELERAHSNL